MTGELVTLTVDGAVATITINRPDSLNTLTSAALAELEQRLEAVEADDSIRAFIVTGAGPKAFVAGADINELNALPDGQAAEEFARTTDRIFQRIATMPKPSIAAINGFALGGGCELALACDIRIAGDNARMGQPEVNYGILAGWGGTQRLPRLVGPGMAKYLLFTGEIIRADEALRIGLVDRVVPADELLAEVRRIAETIAAKGPVAIRLTKQLVNRALETPLEEGLVAEARGFADTFETQDRKEGTSAFLEKRSPRFTGQ